MPEQESKKPTHDASWLTHQWVVAGLVSASARFVPIPFVDDIVREQCQRFVVSRTLFAHGTTLATSELKPFYSTGGGCLGGCATSVVRVPLKLLLFPVRKFVSIVTSVHGVPLEVMRMVLLGRTLDRYLADQKLSADPQLAAQMKSAFDEAFARMDFRVIRAAMSDALSSVSGWKTSAMESAREVAGLRDAESDGLNPSTGVGSGAEKVQQVLDRPETMTLFAEFDRRFDDSLQCNA